MQAENGEVAARHTDTGIIDFSKFRRPENPSRSWKQRLLRSANGGFITDRQLVAALGAAAGEDSAAVGSLHANTKAVSFSALAIIGLKGTFGHSRFLFCLSYVGARERTATDPLM